MLLQYRRMCVEKSAKLGPESCFWQNRNELLVRVELPTEDKYISNDRTEAWWDILSYAVLQWMLTNIADLYW
jgi:hypothetical protein